MSDKSDALSLLQRAFSSQTGMEISPAQRFGLRLRTWRRSGNIKQAALAQILGVSQPAIARWESGKDTPSAKHVKHIQSLMAGSMRDELALEALFVKRQTGMRALFDYDGVRMLAVSEGFRDIWPEFSSLSGTCMADHLVNEAQQLLGGGEIGQHVREGALGIVSGVSFRHTDIEADTAIPHRWHIRFRQYGGLRLADIVYEPCAINEAVGITDLVYLDRIGEKL